VDSPRETRQVTGLLRQWERGDHKALGELMREVTPNLRRVAVNCLARESGGDAHRPTGLVNECYIRLARQRRVHWHNRTQFFSVAARIMRRILIDRARRRCTAKRTAVPVPAVDSPPSSDHLIVGLDLRRALSRLRRLDPRQARVVELRYLAGMTVDETAKTVGVSPRTVKLDWRMARAFLSRELGGSGGCAIMRPGTTNG
jgi:RNA polymerase sigma factor (TIGR02999 family)